MFKKHTFLTSITAFATLFALVVYQVINLPVASLVLANAGNPISNPVSIPVSNPISSPVIDPDSTLNNGLLAYWKFDEATVSGQSVEYYDYSTNGFTAKGVGSVVTTEGRFAGAAHLNGVNSYIKTSSNSALSPQTVSVSMWVKINSYAGAYPRLISKHGSYDINMYTYHAPSAGRIEWDVRRPQETDVNTSAANRLQLGQWYHLVTIYDGNTSKIYINGVKVGEKLLVPGTIAPTPTHPLTIGALLTSAGAQRFADIDVDETRIYNRALTVSEILELAQK